MKICVYGAGAIGGYFGVVRAEAGADIRRVAQGPQLEAKLVNGVHLQIGDTDRGRAQMTQRARTA